MAVELQRLRYFVVLAEELHFTRAAHRLHLAQQALSAQIRQLESELGAELFRRTTRKVELTDAGRTLLAHAVPILASVASACDEVRRTASGDIGVLKLAYTPTVSYEALPKLTDAMRRRYPAVRLRMTEMWQADAVHGVAAGRFDVGFARCPVLHDDLASVVLRDEPLGVVLGHGHRLVSRPAVRIDELSSEALMIWPRELSPRYHDRVVEFLRRHGFTGRVREFENLNREVLIGDVVARMEVAALRAFSVAFATEATALAEGFVWRPLDPLPLIPLDMFWKPAAGSLVQNFVRLARAVAEQQRWLAPVPA